MKKLIIVLMLALLCGTIDYSYAQVDIGLGDDGPGGDPNGGGSGGGGGGGGSSTWGAYTAGSSSSTTWGTVWLYEGNNGTQDLEWLFHVTSTSTHDFDFVHDNILNGDSVQVHFNDEVRSARFSGIVSGKTFVFYNDPGGDTDDDYTTVVFKQDIPDDANYLLFTFENSYEDDYVIVTAVDHGQIDGKISHLTVY